MRPTKVFVDGKYQAPDTRYGKNGESFHPGLHYWVGGNCKVYGSALCRFREEDFKDLRTFDGLFDGWPVGYVAQRGTIQPRFFIAGRKYLLTLDLAR